MAGSSARDGLRTRLRRWFQAGKQVETEDTRRWKRKSLGYILWFLVIIALVIAGFSPFIFDGATRIHVWGVVLIPLVGMLLNRKGFLVPAGIIAVVLPMASNLVFTIDTGVAHVAIYSIWSLFVAAVVFNFRVTILLVCADVAALLLIALVSPRFTVFPTGWDIARHDYFSTTIVFIVITPVAFAICYDYLMRLYREVGEARKHLEEKVELRTAQIRSFQDQLLQAQKMESIGRLAAGVAHDFNNILTAVLGNASIGKLPGVSGEKMMKYFSSIETAALRGKELTGKLLGFSRQGQYDVEVLDINEVVQEVFGLLKRTTRREVEVRCRLAVPLSIKCDRIQIEQSLLNICINARDAIEGTGTIDISVHAETVERGDVPDLEAGSYTAITVSDTGKGMDEETRSRIFEPFFTTKEKGKGTGLGLAMTYGIVRNHGGAIQVTSAPGEGTTLTMLLPVTEKQPASKKETTGFIAAQRRATILVVDDEQDVCVITADMLSMLGYKVLQTTSGQESIKIYNENRAGVDLVLLDVSMPEMTVPMVLERLCAVDPSVKVLIFSGYGLDSEIQDMLANGASGFIRKPFTIRMLNQKIEEVLT